MQVVGRFVFGKAHVAMGAEEFGRGHFAGLLFQRGSHRVEQCQCGRFELGFIGWSVFGELVFGVVVGQRAEKGAAVGNQCSKGIGGHGGTL